MDILDQYTTMNLPYLRISLTPDCNAACSFCHNDGQLTGRRGLESLVESSIPFTELNFLAKSFKQLFSRVKFTGGEPTLVKELPDIVRLFDTEGYDTSITTNGFLLDENMQRILSSAGLKSVNVSIPSLDQKQYSETFGIAPSIEEVLHHVHTLPDTFPNNVKINYMALPGKTAPDFEQQLYENDQLVPLLQLSSELQGTPISIMQLVSKSDGEYLTDLLSYAEKQVGPAFEMQIPGGINRRHVVFANGGVVEHDDFRDDHYREKIFDNPYCERCEVKESCVEGPYALRVGTNLRSNETFLKPCLIRTDNETYLNTVMGTQ